MIEYNSPIQTIIKPKDTIFKKDHAMSDNKTANEQYVNNVLMSVIGESLIKADASFLFGCDFSDIIDKYSLLLQKKKPETDIYRKLFEELKQLIAAINISTPFLGDCYNAVINKIDFLEREICD